MTVGFDKKLVDNLLEKISFSQGNNFIFDVKKQTNRLTYNRERSYRQTKEIEICWTVKQERGQTDRQNRERDQTDR